MTEWNPRYVAYAKAHGTTPEAMIEEDRVNWPGGVMTGFILWIGDHWRAWLAERGLPSDHPKSDEDHASFDRRIGA